MLDDEIIPDPLVDSVDGHMPVRRPISVSGSPELSGEKEKGRGQGQVRSNENASGKAILSSVLMEIPEETIIVDPLSDGEILPSRIPSLPREEKGGPSPRNHEPVKTSLPEETPEVVEEDPLPEEDLPRGNGSGLSRTEAVVARKAAVPIVAPSMETFPEEGGGGPDDPAVIDEEVAEEKRPSVEPEKMGQDSGNPLGSLATGEDRIVDLLCEMGKLSSEKLEELKAETMADGRRKSWVVAVDRGYVTSRDIAACMAKFHKMKLLTIRDLDQAVHRQNLYRNLDFYAKVESLPLVDGGIAVWDISRAASIQSTLPAGKGKGVSSVNIADRIDIQWVISEAYSTQRVSVVEMTEFARINKGRGVVILDKILEMAVRMKSSDIHFEPHGDTALIRIRIHGDLEPLMYLSKESFKDVMTTLTNWSEVINQSKSKDVDGKIEKVIGGRSISFRVGFLPTIYGIHTAVARVLDNSYVRYDLETMGYEEEDARRLIRMARNISSGAILTTGPTGSGKSSTNHAISAAMDLERKKIIEVSDPVEYRHPHGVQAQIYEVDEKSKWDYADAGKAVLRQDPDIIYLGEIRDKESASEAMTSANTGHLLISTLHVNRAFDVPSRLLKFGVDLYDIIGTVKIVINQRLLKRLCPACGQKVTVRPEDRIGIFESLLDVGTMVGAPAPRGTECVTCGGRGYTGRYAISEILYMNDSLKTLLDKHRGKSGDLLEMEFNTATGGNGWQSIYKKAVQDAKAGKTSMESVISVLGVL